MKYHALILLALSFYLDLSAQNLEVDGKVKVSDMDTINSVSGSLTLLGDGTIAFRHYSIGEIAQGGIIFYLDETGQHGLVADTADLSAATRWYAGTLDRTRALGDGLFAGEMNTAIIIAAQIAIGDDDDDYAAFICSMLQRGDYGDWYLPSAKELELMYDNLHTNNIGEFVNDFYWSSTEKSDNTALVHGFGTNTTNFATKSAVHRVRAIRSF